MAAPNPQIGDLVLPLALFDGPVEERWADESTYLAGRVRTRRKGPGRYRGAWSWTFVGTAAQWADVVVALQGDEAGEIDWVPRGRDVFRARCTSELTTLTPLYRRDRATGDPLYLVEIAVEALSTVAALPPVHVPPRAQALAYVVDGDGAALLTDPDAAFVG